MSAAAVSTRQGVPELLAPAGDEASLGAALAAGADAVYFGLDDGFNARARAQNFSLAELATTCRRIHRAGARAYLTLNTLVFEDELAVVCGMIRAAALAGVDALIVQDLAVARLARALAPTLEVHASTQMTLSSPAAAEIATALGITRVVLPRELSLTEIAQYRAGTTLGLEVFVHGALCVSWSGQCLTSEAWGGRSANRGQCAQSCRMPYSLVVDGVRRELGDVSYLLSPKDLAAAPLVDELARIGVASVKIEGRQKGSAYVATATATYRRVLDELAAGASGPDAALSQDLARMALVYSRGFSPGFLAGSDHQSLVDARAPRHRGILLGRVARVGRGSVTVEPATPGTTGEAGGAQARLDRLVHAAQVGPRPGMGVVFDAGRPEAAEQGGPIYAVVPDGAGWSLEFGAAGPDLARVGVGDRVWATSDPAAAHDARRLEAKGDMMGRIGVALTVSGVAGAPLVVRAQASGPVGRGALVELAGACPLVPSTGAGLDAELVGEKLGALGGTPFRLATLDTSALAPGLHAPVSSLKALRRELVDRLWAAVEARTRHAVACPDALAQVRDEATVDYRSVAPYVAPASPRVVPLVRTDEQLDAAIELGFTEVELDWMEMVGLGRAVARARAAGMAVTVATPRVHKPGEDVLDRRIAALAPDGVLVRSLSALVAFAKHPAGSRPAIHGDFSLNATNSIAAATLIAQGADTVTFAHDLDAPQLFAMCAHVPAARFTATLHHHLPTFHTEHCVYSHLLSEGRDYRSCGRPCEHHAVSLADDRGLEHPVLVDVGCRNTVFNASAQCAPGLFARLAAAGVRRFRVELVREDRAVARTVLAAWRALAAGEIAPDELVRRVRVHEQFGVTMGTMRTLAQVPIRDGRS